MRPLFITVERTHAPAARRHSTSGHDDLLSCGFAPPFPALAPVAYGDTLASGENRPVMRSARVLLGTAMLGLATSAHAEWRRFETAHFIIYSESGDKRVNELAAGLEKIDGLMRMATGLSADVEPVKVRSYEMADEGPVQQALGEVSTGVAGFYSSNIFGPYAVTLRKAYSGKA